MEIAAGSLLGAVRSFIAAEQGADDAQEVGVETQLFVEGYIDSFAVVRLIAALERDLGLDLPPGALIPEDFASVETLRQRLAEL